MKVLDTYSEEVQQKSNSQNCPKMSVFLFAKEQTGAYRTPRINILLHGGAQLIYKNNI